VPALFIAGEKDLVIAGATKDQLIAMMSSRVDNLSVDLLPDTGHLVQQERAEEVNIAISRFLASLPRLP
jgi:pimeloyl-ACP methyl ester carboxylesterase